MEPQSGIEQPFTIQIFLYYIITLYYIDNQGRPPVKIKEEENKRYGYIKALISYKHYFYYGTLKRGECSCRPATPRACL